MRTIGNVAKKAAGFDGWVSYIRSRWNWALNPELPVLTPWKTVTPINTPTWVLERNPYYMGVDTAGNQLPYIDRISMTLAENLEVLNLRAVAGQYDLQRPEQSVKLLVTMARNKLISAARRERRQRRDHRRNAAVGDDLNQIASREPDPGERAVGKELLERVQLQLSNEERQLV